MTQLGIHFIDTLQFLVGPIRRVGTLARSAVLRRGGDRPVVDSTVAILELESGVIATMQSHYVVAPVYILVLHGVDGSLTCREDRIDVVRRAEGEYLSWSLPTPERDGESFTSEVAEFIDCLVARRQPETGAEVGYRNVALLDAMRRSVEEGRFVHIDEIISS